MDTIISIYRLKKLELLRLRDLAGVSHIINMELGFETGYDPSFHCSIFLSPKSLG